ncbi:MAG: nitrilotriacetate monooxygenase [Rickettsiales bacterium]|jgi:flavin reductase (DIM6/NTAB) family NADH-FMN oxidoreductase RutF|nr:nitrilotriacetate monooxygenase [Rickettsiales bacterium]
MKSSLLTDTQFKKGLGSFATGVAVITALSQHNSPIAHGITVNSFTSLSLHPPLLLFCLDKEAQAYSIFTECAYFAVNILSEGQEQHSRHFALSAQKDFASVPHHIGLYDLPLISGSVAHIACKLYQLVDGGDHTIIQGEVLKVEHDDTKSPLVYYRGHYTPLVKR